MIDDGSCLFSLRVLEYSVTTRLSVQVAACTALVCVVTRIGSYSTSDDLYSLDQSTYFYIVAGSIAHPHAVLYLQGCSCSPASAPRPALACLYCTAHSRW